MVIAWGFIGQHRSMVDNVQPGQFKRIIKNIMTRFYLALLVTFVHQAVKILPRENELSAD